MANRTLVSVMEWVISHRLVLNVERCICLLVSFQGMPRNRPPTIRFNSVSLLFVAHVEYLEQRISSLTLNLTSFTGLGCGASGGQFRKLYLQS